MSLPNIFTPDVSEKMIRRINKPDTSTQPTWGKMTVGKMLAHCNVTYEMLYKDKHAKPNFLMRLILKSFVKNCNRRNALQTKFQTAPQFRMKETKDFETEKNHLISYLKKTLQLDEAHFESKLPHSFGILNKTEWNNMFYKQPDHHFTQFGV